MPHSYELARGLLLALSHRHDSTWHCLWWTSWQHWLEHVSDTQIASELTSPQLAGATAEGVKNKFLQGRHISKSWDQLLKALITPCTVIRFWQGSTLSVRNVLCMLLFYLKLEAYRDTERNQKATSGVFNLRMLFSIFVISLWLPLPFIVTYHKCTALFLFLLISRQHAVAHQSVPRSFASGPWFISVIGRDFLKKLPFCYSAPCVLKVMNKFTKCGLSDPTY